MRKIHPCCKKCVFGCKQPYAEWSPNVPYSEFCKLFESLTEEDEQRASRWEKL